jgi:hypothetical protein
MDLHLMPQDAAGSEVVAIAEAAGDAEDLELGELVRLAQQGLDMEHLGLGAGCSEGERGVAVAIGAGGSKAKDAGLRHGNLSSNGSKDDFTTSACCQESFRTDNGASIFTWPEERTTAADRQRPIWRHVTRAGLVDRGRFGDRDFDQKPAIRFGEETRGD